MPPVQAGFTVAMPELAKRLNESTQGRIQFQLFSGGEIAPPPELYTTCANGMVDMILSTGGHYFGVMPLANVEGSLALNFRDSSDIAVLQFDKGLLPLFQAEHTKHGTHFLTLLAAGRSGLISKKPIHTIADLKGYKIRTFGGYSPLYASLGATPVTMPLGEAYLALSTGTVDAAVTGFSAHLDLKHYEVAKYALQTDQGAWSLVMNNDAWEALPDDLKSILTLTVYDFADWWVRNYDLYNPSVEGLKEKGVEFVDMEPGEFAKFETAAIALWDEVAAKDAVAAKAIGILKDYYAKKD
ncbi:TRAP transporter substrate-binding protein [Chloroflexota bacterium]